ncbi:hypothetical protein J6590_043950 [Homalodisca vitripennis]|nr:hypothetical protein J6590_043950 [Homalodisca vitripennis]
MTFIIQNLLLGNQQSIYCFDGVTQPTSSPGATQDNGKCLGWHDGPNRPYQWLHYNETLLRARNLGSGLVSLGLAPSPSTYIGIYSQNCPEWVLVEQGAYCYSMVIVPLYDTLGPDACAFIINQAEISVVVCENDAKCNLLLDRAPRCLRKLIVIHETRLATNQRAKNRGIEVLRFEDVERNGAIKNNPEVEEMRYAPRVSALEFPVCGTPFSSLSLQSLGLPTKTSCASSTGTGITKSHYFSPEGSQQMPSSTKYGLLSLSTSHNPVWYALPCLHPDSICSSRILFSAYEIGIFGNPHAQRETV